MSFDPAAITQLAKLACLNLPPDSLSQMGDDMSAIFGLIDTLQAVDTKGVAPLAHPLATIEELTLTCRADVAMATDIVGSLANASETENGLFLVPRVIE